MCSPTATSVTMLHKRMSAVVIAMRVVSIRAAHAHR